MKRVLRNLRGGLGIALISGVAWALVLFITYILAAFDPEFGNWSLRNLWRFPAAAGVFGFVTGGVFAGGLRVLSRTQRWERIRPARAALLGAAAGLIGFGLVSIENLLGGAPPLPDDAVFSLVLVGLLGAGVSVAMVRLAQSGSPALESGDPVASVGPSSQRQLAGDDSP